MVFSKLDDTPFFRKQLAGLEDSAEALRERCNKLHKASRRYAEGLQEAQDADNAFVQGLEAFGGVMDDPISVAVGGPVMTKFTAALRELGTYKEVLKSQVEHMLNERLAAFKDQDLSSLKELRKRFDKASQAYDQVREKFLSLKRDAKQEVVAEAEEDLQEARLLFEQSRFNLVTAVSSIEAKKKFEFLEAVSASMDAHLRYFKQGYELLKTLEPYIHQVLTYAQQSRERANLDQAALAERMQDFRRQSETGFADQSAASGQRGGVGPLQGGGTPSHKEIDRVMRSTSQGKVQVIKQGYLLKRSSNLRGDWKRRFFVLDSRGMLYYYTRNTGGKPSGLQGVVHSSVQGFHSSMHGLLHAKPQDPFSSLFNRILPGHHGSHASAPSSAQSHDAPQPANARGDHGAAAGSGGGGATTADRGGFDETEKHTVDLLTSTIKLDAEQGDLRFCFRIISPSKAYTLQAENGAERAEWVDKITGVIASLLSAQLGDPARHRRRTRSDGVLSALEDGRAGEVAGDAAGDQGPAFNGFTDFTEQAPLELLRQVAGNDKCVDCGMPGPEWASLNLGVLMCIQCSGFHRNMGVHISKVRSTTLDVRAWEPGVMAYIMATGNEFANSIWEADLQVAPRGGSDSAETQHLEGQTGRSEQSVAGTSKPGPEDRLTVKERFILAKYQDRRYVLKPAQVDGANRLWNAVKDGDIQTAAGLLISLGADANTTFEMAYGLPPPSHKADRPESLVSGSGISGPGTSTLPPASAAKGSEPPLAPGTPSELVSVSGAGGDASPAPSGLSRGASGDDLRGGSVLHLACRRGDLAAVELLLQHGAALDALDWAGRTPLHLCMLCGHDTCAKVLLTRGASVVAKDREGRTSLETAMELGAVADEELFLALSDVGS